MSRSTATTALLEPFPTMKQDKELFPLMQRTAVIERLLAATKTKLDDPSTTPKELARMYEEQKSLLANMQTISTKIELIVFERLMYMSIARFERGVSRLGIRRSNKMC